VSGLINLPNQTSQHTKFKKIRKCDKQLNFMGCFLF
jgi:hypothetical protein